MRVERPEIIVTCGPGFEPVDNVRRITNLSTGAIGRDLCGALLPLGLPIRCFRGELATARWELPGVDLESFSTGGNLLERCRKIEEQGSVRLFLHAAALGDFRVSRILNEDGGEVTGAKISSRMGKLLVELEPAIKVITQLPSLFPNARIIGWKFEVEGSRQEAIEKGISQIKTNDIFACVVNGAAVGPGFVVVQKSGELTEFASRESLAAGLVALAGLGEKSEKV